MDVMGLEEILNRTSEQIEQFHQDVRSSGDPLSGKDWDSLLLVLKQTHREIHKSLKGAKQVPKLSDKTMNRIWNALRSLPSEPSAQVKVGALETSLFYQTLKEFQNLLDSLKVKRGERPEKTDLGGL